MAPKKEALAPKGYEERQADALERIAGVLEGLEMFKVIDAAIAARMKQDADAYQAGAEARAKLDAELAAMGSPEGRLPRSEADMNAVSHLNDEPAAGQPGPETK